jgi:hypothetical protein
MTEPLLPDTTSDERQIGWGDDAAPDDRDGARDDERLRDERPPHYDRD